MKQSRGGERIALDEKRVNSDFPRQAWRILQGRESCTISGMKKARGHTRLRETGGPGSECHKARVMDKRNSVSRREDKLPATMVTHKHDFLCTSLEKASHVLLVSRFYPTTHLAIISSFAQKLVAAMLTAWLMTQALRIDTWPLRDSNSRRAALE